MPILTVTPSKAATYNAVKSFFAEFFGTPLIDDDGSNLVGEFTKVPGYQLYYYPMTSTGYYYHKLTIVTGWNPATNTYTSIIPTPHRINVDMTNFVLFKSTDQKLFGIIAWTSGGSMNKSYDIFFELDGKWYRISTDDYTNAEAAILSVIEPNYPSFDVYTGQQKTILSVNNKYYAVPIYLLKNNVIMGAIPKMALLTKASVATDNPIINGDDILLPGNMLIGRITNFTWLNAA